MARAEFAVAGLKGLVIANSPASMELWISEANRLRDALPPDLQATLLAHEAAGTTDSKEYFEAMKVFYERHVCRVVPMPDEVARTYFPGNRGRPNRLPRWTGRANSTSLAPEQLVDHRSPCRYQCPDLADLRQARRGHPCNGPALCRRDPRRALAYLRGLSHMPHVEETAACLKVVGDFAKDTDERATGRTGKSPRQ